MKDRYSVAERTGKSSLAAMEKQFANVTWAAQAAAPGVDKRFGLGTIFSVAKENCEE
jgi:hypothetical protein